MYRFIIHFKRIFYIWCSLEVKHHFCMWISTYWVSCIENTIIFLASYKGHVERKLEECGFIKAKTSSCFKREVSPFPSPSKKVKGKKRKQKLKKRLKASDRLLEFRNKHPVVDFTIRKLLQTLWEQLNVPRAQRQSTIFYANLSLWFLKTWQESLKAMKVIIRHNIMWLLRILVLISDLPL